MKRSHLTVSSFAALLALSVACSGDRAPGQWPIAKSELERGASALDPGEATYRRYCVGCHGSDGTGNGGRTGANFTLASGPLLQKADAELMASVREGKRGATATMPAHKPVLTDPQIAAVIAYVKKRFAQH